MKTPDAAAPRPGSSGEPIVTLADIAHERAPRYRTLSIVIPCFNERATLATLVMRVLASPVALHKEIVIVDDGSTDGSTDVVRSLAETHRSPRASFVTLFHDSNRGKGAALRTGFAAATGDIVIVQDADLEYDPDDYPALVKPIVDGVAKVVYGSRWLNRHFDPPHPERRWFVIGNWIVTQLANLLYGAHVTDNATCYKAFDAEVLKSLDLRCDGFDFCPEVTARVRQRGHRIWEVPIYYTPRSVADGKKIRARDGIEAVWTLVRCRFTR